MSTTKYIQLEEELYDYKSVLSKASEAILDQEISKYPVFVAHQQEFEIGIILVDSAKSGGLWTIHASTLEEFVSKQIIQPDKIDSFRDVFKDPQEFFCIFVLSELGANFIFLPKQNKTIL